MSAVATRGRKPDRDNPFLPFLTAFDPTDLPGGSVDPLGFDRGYNFLADKILPGLTNVASQPRYFGLLCAGAVLGKGGTNTRADAIERERCVIRLERLWALANVLAADGEELSAAGIRGITYAEAQRDALARAGRTKTSTEFPLLARQVQYGVLGIYGNVAHGMGLIDRRSLALTPEFGEALGESFLEETDAPQTVLRAVREEDTEVGLDGLRGWGARAHIQAPLGKCESAVVRQAIHGNAVRSRMLQALAVHPHQEGDSELKRLVRIARDLPDDSADLREAIAVIVPYEGAYQHAVLTLERVLWACGASGSVALTELAADEVITVCVDGLRKAVAKMCGALDTATTVQVRQDVVRLDQVRSFLVGAAGATTTSAFVEAVLGQHGAVQHGKFDQGRRKLPWVEIHDGRAVLTLARSGQIAGEPRRPGDVASHAYRTGSADALLAAAREA